MKICVVGLGKIGLPLAVQYAARGFEVFGADVNESTVRQVNEGVEPFPGEYQLAEKLRGVVNAGLLSATTDTTHAVSQSDVVVIVVPLFVDSESQPDFGWMDAATVDVGRGLRAGTLVSYETTLPVGTTRNRFAPMLEENSGLLAGQDFSLVFSPERVLTGRVFADLRRYPKLVGGLDEQSEAAGAEFYRAVLEFDERDDLTKPNGVWEMGTCEAAEMAKLAETTYRDVNIGLANQFARFADGNNINIFNVIEACNSQPYSHIHNPGIAVGGHCIPVYPRLYLYNDPSATIVRAARESNANMPEYCVEILERAVGNLNGQTIAVLGAAYRGGVKETAFSGIFAVVDALNKRNATVLVHDPLYDDHELISFGWKPYDLNQPVDGAIIQADHQLYSSVSIPAKVIVDGRNVSPIEAGGQVLTLGKLSTSND